MKKPILLISILCVFASLFCCSSCVHYGRMVKYYTADIDDHKIFPATEVKPSTETFYFEDATQSFHANKIEGLKITRKEEKMGLTQFLDKYTTTTAFLVIRRDSILYEKYFEDYTKDSISNIFSVSKSITSLLVGVAIDEGKIKSVDDIVTDYLPVLKEGHPYFNQLTIRHLLDMRAGFKFDETYANPFDEVSKLYYGENQLEQIVKIKFAHEPGQVHEYQSAQTALLGMLVEASTGQQLGKYLEAKVWKPLHMENRATWSLDDEKNKNAKAFCCLNTTAIDLAKIGRLYLNNGQFNKQQIVSKNWVDASTQANVNNDNYQYQWYSPEDTDTLYAGDFYALGILGQHIYVSPQQELIVVRLGKSNMPFGTIVHGIKKTLDKY